MLRDEFVENIESYLNMESVYDLRILVAIETMKKIGEWIEGMPESTVIGSWAYMINNKNIVLLQDINIRDGKANWFAKVMNGSSLQGTWEITFKRG